ncbi:phospholipase/carboxylesterase/thioesterase [Janthinobacterium sp. HH01]|uniref:alpha/beta hydrolase n=1 Tax=Janthinobacterium sp. HH01 TaxID=1198452 RepID=UPI0002AE8BCA|nr:alpha/beta hydrolase-fold protein [Janthinobacterium sp. HH01]ELX10606.1 phospholipase/carboxylesterase/thioesterase [Janthinobacterium sp. HH01]
MTAGPAPAAPAPYSDGRLHARPALWRRPPVVLPRPLPLEAGSHMLAFPNHRHARLYVPPHDGAAPLPLLVLLHGAGGQHGGGDAIALAHATRHGTLLLLPEAQSTSWDVLRGGYGADLAFIDRLLAWAMQRYQVDAGAVTIGGFSDGASYALSVGLMNGELFGDILAFSPGFIAPLRRSGMPRVFIAHGTQDQVLSVERGKAIALKLAGEGYDVRYAEFDGAHLVEPVIAHAALRQLAAR